MGKVIRAGWKVLIRQFVTIILLTIAFFVWQDWRDSARYSERQLFYVGKITLEVFSASSLVRVSLVNGQIGRFGSKTFFRHPNARGKFMIRPVTPEFRYMPNLFEITFGYWHVIALLVPAAAVSFFLNLRGEQEPPEESASFPES